MKRRSVGVLTASAVLGTCMAGVSHPAASSASEPGKTTRVSLASNGGEAKERSTAPSISGDGRFVAFVSSATNLDPRIDPTFHPGNEQVFVHDRQTGETSLVSISPATDNPRHQGDGNSSSPSVSSDGNLVAFDSTSTNLTKEDTRKHTQVFLYDRLADKTITVSAGRVGDGDGDSFDPAISADGSDVAFTSFASNLPTAPVKSPKSLAAAAVSEPSEIWVRTVNPLSAFPESASVGVQSFPDGNSYEPAISADGTYVTFTSRATTMTSDDTDSKEDVFRRDRAAKETILVSRDTNGNHTGASDQSSVSGDGNLVAFRYSNPTRKAYDVLLRDVAAANSALVSVDSSGAEAKDDSIHPAISGDGAVVAFESNGDNLVDEDNNQLHDIFVHDLADNRTARMSVATNGAEGDGDSRTPAISRTGRYVAFESDAANLVGDDPGQTSDTNDVSDVFVRDRAPAIQFDPATVDFGQRPLGTATKATVVAKSLGFSPVHLTQTTVSGPDAGAFSITNDGCKGAALARNQTCSVDVSFTAAGGPRVADLVFNHDAPVPPNATKVALSGQTLAGDSRITPDQPTNPEKPGTTDNGTTPTQGPGPSQPARPGGGQAGVLGETLPRLTVNPGIGRPGIVALAQGTGFPSDTDLLLVWDQGLARQPVHTDSEGNFAVPVLVFRRGDQLGPRRLTATRDGHVLASTAFLVVPGSFGPPDFLVRR